MSNIEKIKSKLVAAQNCHPHATQTLIAEALIELDALASAEHKQEQEVQKVDEVASLKTELGRAYRCIMGMHTALKAANVEFGSSGYHTPTIGAAKRFVWEGELDGSNYFIGKPVEVLHAALRLPEVASHG